MVAEVGTALAEVVDIPAVAGTALVVVVLAVDTGPAVADTVEVDTALAGAGTAPEVDIALAGAGIALGVDTALAGAGIAPEAVAPECTAVPAAKTG